MSRSVKLDYEKLQNPGNTRKLPPYTVRMCRCYLCKLIHPSYRKWVVQWDGIVVFKSRNWNRAYAWATGDNAARRWLNNVEYGKAQCGSYDVVSAYPDGWNTL